GGGSGTQWPNRPDWNNRPGGGGSGTQWPNRPNRPDWNNRPGWNGGGTQWPNRPNWPGNGDIGNWLNMPGNNWANRPNRWNNLNNVGNNYNTVIANRGDTIRNNFVNSGNVGGYGNMFTPNWYGANAGGYFWNYPTTTPYY